MRTFLAIFLGKLTAFISKLSNLGAGGTWPGEITLTIHPTILSSLLSQIQEGVIIVAGTNGKTTTSLMIKKILETEGKKVIHNDTGANLLNGIVSAFIKNSDWLGNIDDDWGVFEVDEATLPHLIRELGIYSSSEPKASREVSLENKVSSRSASWRTSNNKRVILVLLNLFRDQLDRYGEVDVIAEKWQKALDKLPENSIVILNADDPLIAHLGKKLNISSSSEPQASREVSLENKVSSRSASWRTSNNRIIYFGIDDPKQFLKNREHATDSIFCLNCGGRLNYEGIYYSHIGIWQCEQCGEKRPKPDLTSWDSPLPGLYNQYNTLAAVTVVKTLGIEEPTINEALANFSPAFGRQEEFDVDGKKVKIFLSKNPAGFNASLRTVLELKPRTILLALNDRIPDGRDVSWIWDVDFEVIPEDVNVIVSGDRIYDMALRIKYAREYKKLNIKYQKYIEKIKNELIVEQELSKAIAIGLEIIKTGETLFVLPTYSAMLEVRKILTGRKIL